MIAAIAIAAALSALPNPTTTPGVLNPAVTQANIAETVCKAGWTATIRPPVSYTNKLKALQLIALGFAINPVGGVPAGAIIDPHSVEEDHLISLQLGGDPRDPANLWPEPWDGPWGARRKDVFESFLKRAVCRGEITLERAQSEIRTDWIAGYLSHPQLPPVAAPHP